MSNIKCIDCGSDVDPDFNEDLFFRGMTLINTISSLVDDFFVDNMRRHPPTELCPIMDGMLVRYMKNHFSTMDENLNEIDFDRWLECIVNTFKAEHKEENKEGVE